MNYIEEPIAIVGMACRFPGSANRPEALWSLLVSGREAIGSTPKERWNLDAFFDSEPDSPGKMYTRWGGFLSEDIRQFDPQFFKISPLEAKTMDPQQRLFLEVSWEAFEDAAINPFDLVASEVGVFAGVYSHDYFLLQMRNVERINAYSITGTSSGLVSGRLSHIYGFNGPCMTIDTSSSSSLAAVHLAFRSLRTQECRVAVVGGVNLILTPETTIGYCKSRSMSRDGKSRVFDEGASGYSRGEGCGVVVLKGLKDAIESGDRIQAVIRGTAMNHDGRSESLMVPSETAQVALLNKAFLDAGIESKDIAYIETHGTGTRVGDPVEIRAISAVMKEKRSKDSPLVLSSIKTNFGHLEAAAGMAGLIKMVLCLQKKQIPPHLNFTKANSEIRFEEIPGFVPSKVIPFPMISNRRLGGVSSFGISGTNVHVVLEEAPEPKKSDSSSLDRSAHVLTLSADESLALKDLVKKYLDFLGNGSETLLPTVQEVCHTSNVGRAHFSERLSVVVSSLDSLKEKLSGFLEAEIQSAVIHGSTNWRATEQGIPPAPVLFRSEGKVHLVQRKLNVPSFRDSIYSLDHSVGGKWMGEKCEIPKIAFLFTGQGSQYTGMGKKLYETSACFRNNIDKCESILKEFLDIRLTDLLFEAKYTDRLTTDIVSAQTALSAIEYSLAKLWISWGVIPDVVLGHSMGEYVAACISGVLSLQDMFLLVYQRNTLYQKLGQKGGLIAVKSSPEDLREFIEPYSGKLSVAAFNGPVNTLVSGELESLNCLKRDLEAKSIKVTTLPPGLPSHCSLMDPILDEFERIARSVSHQSPKIPWISCLSASLVRDGEIGSQYWRKHLREVVRFSDSCKTLYEMGCRIFLEMGPGTVLLSLSLHLQPPNLKGVWLPSLRKEREEWEQILESVGTLYVHGVPMNWSGFEQGNPKRKKVSLPTYPFQRQSYWLDGSDLAHSIAKPVQNYSFIGNQIQSPRLKDIVLEAEYNEKSCRGFGDFRILDRSYLSISLQLIRVLMALNEMGVQLSSVEFKELEFRHPLLLEGQDKSVQLVLGKTSENQYQFEIFSRLKGFGSSIVWESHVTGLVEISGVSNEPKDTKIIAGSDLNPSLIQESYIEEYESQFSKIGLVYGSLFKLLDKFWCDDHDLASRIRISRLDSNLEYPIHPGYIESALQCLLIRNLISKKNVSIPLIPDSIQSLRLSLPCASPILWGHLISKANTSDSLQWIEGDYRLLTPDGRAVIEIKGFKLREFSNQESTRLPLTPKDPGSLQLDKNRPISFLATLKTVSEDERREKLLEYLNDETVAMLGLKHRTRLDIQKPLKLQGVDSLMSIELRKRIRKSLEDRYSLPSTLIADCPTLDSLAEFLLSFIFSSRTSNADSR